VELAQEARLIPWIAPMWTAAITGMAESAKVPAKAVHCLMICKKSWNKDTDPYSASQPSATVDNNPNYSGVIIDNEKRTRKRIRN
jgi:hypothetical protein